MGDAATPSSPPREAPKSSSPHRESTKSPTSPRAATKSPTPAPALSPIQDTTPLVADDNPEEEEDDGIDVTAQSDTTSLKSSILKYRQENGRTYHAYKDGSYVLPNDETESERLDLQHTLFLLTWDHALHVAPLDKPPTRVLDAGCGTGIWSIEFADEYPESEVTGVDLSPIQPAFVPPNTRFLIDDLEDDWEFPTPFDFIFSRFMTGSILNWPRYFKQAYEYVFPRILVLPSPTPATPSDKNIQVTPTSNLSPGGVIELQDIIYPMTSDDGTLTEDSSLYRWGTLLNEAFRGIGRPMDTAYAYEEQLRAAGFVDVKIVQEKWPTNKWPRDKKYKQMGIWNTENLLTGLGALSLAVFTRPKEEGGLGWSTMELEVLLAGVRKDIKDTSIHAYWKIFAVHARKPESAV